MYNRPADRLDGLILAVVLLLVAVLEIALCAIRE